MLLRVRHGRNILEVNLEGEEDQVTLSQLTSELEKRTNIKAHHQRLIGPKGLVIRGKLFASSKKEKNQNNNEDGQEGEEDEKLSSLGISHSSQLFLIGASGMPQNQNQNQNNNLMSTSVTATAAAVAGRGVEKLVKNNNNNNQQQQEQESIQEGKQQQQQQQQQYADISNLLVVPQPSPHNPETTLLKCSYSQGYVNQDVFMCTTCVAAGIVEPNHILCSSCAYVCHEDHELVFCGIRRSCRCDCCTSRCIPTPAKRHELTFRWSGVGVGVGVGGGENENNIEKRQSQQEQQQQEEELAHQLAAAARALRRCMFIADETTHVAPALPLPENTENIYPPLPPHQHSCVCDWKLEQQQQQHHQVQEQENQQNQNNNNNQQEQQKNPPPPPAAATLHWGYRDGVSCTVCGQGYSTSHLSQLDCAALACQPCQGVQSCDQVVAAFFCRTCNGFACIGCRLHCHRNHDVDSTPFWFSSRVGGFVDPLRRPVSKRKMQNILARNQQQHQNNNNNNNNQDESDEDGDEDESDDDDEEDNENQAPPLQIFSCICGGKCNLVCPIPLSQFGDAAVEAQKIADSKPISHSSSSSSVSLEHLLHPKSRADRSVPISVCPETVATLLASDQFGVFVCEPCSQKNSNNNENGFLSEIRKNPSRPTCPPCFSFSASSSSNSSSSSSSTEAVVVNSSLESRSSVLASLEEQQKFASCCRTTTLSSSSSSSSSALRVFHGSLIPQIFFEWARGKLICRCDACDADFESKLPGARQLDAGPVELSILVGGYCCSCGQLLEANGTYLCLTCEVDAASKSEHGGGAVAAGGTNQQPSYELCKSCYDIRESLHPADHEFEAQTLGSSLRQVFALVDAEGDASTRLWLREQLNEMSDPMTLLETLVPMLTGRVRLEESERSLRDTASLVPSYDDDDDEDDEDENDENENNEDENQGRDDLTRSDLEEDRESTTRRRRQRVGDQIQQQQQQENSNDNNNNNIVPPNDADASGKQNENNNNSNNNEGEDDDDQDELTEF